MHVLALDTTTRAGSVAVLDDARLLVEIEGDAARSHAERLPGDLLRALSTAGLTTADIDLFAVASGPGSFTGLRIGIAAIQGLAFVHQRPVAAVSALRALADVAADALPADARVGAWMDAHRGDLFTALYTIERRREATALLAELEPAMVSSPGDTVERWRHLGLPAAVCGDGAVKYRSELPSGVALVELRPLASTVGRLALVDAAEGRTVAAAGVQPLYVRRPDAELAREAAARRT
jgi:tRNA threonylcarbamoyladenosine biosynthesis protein TsaB